MNVTVQVVRKRSEHVSWALRIFDAAPNYEQLVKGVVLATTDGVMIVRRSLGLSGAALTTGARVGNRSDAEIANAIDALRP
jgi:hypothetical protein